MLADSDNLSGALTSNKQRLIEMRKLLDCLPEDSARNRNRIHILVIDIFHFSASGYQKANEMELYSALIHLVQETIPLISNENSSVKSSLERILNIGQNASNRDRVMTIIEIKKELQWDTRIFGGPSPSRTDQLTKLNKDPTLCIRMFIEIILMGNLRRY